MKSSFRKWAQSAAIILLIGAVIWGVRKIDFASLADAFHHAEIDFIVFAVLGVFALWICRAAILYTVLRVYEKLPFMKVFAANMIGGMMDLIIPGRGGYVVRWAVLSFHSNVQKSLIVSVLLTAIAMEGTLLVLYMLVALLIDPSILAFTSHTIVYILSALVVALIGGFFLSHPLHRLAKKTWLAKLTPIMGVFEITDHLHSPSRFIPLFLLNAASWGIQIIICYLMGHAFQLDFTFAQMVLLLLSINLAVLVPIVPGNIGTMQIVITTVLTKLGYPAESSLAFAITFHAAHVLPVLALGGLFSISLRSEKANVA